jgi:protein arginine kinase activator
MKVENPLTVLSEYLGKIMDEVFEGDKKNSKSKSKICPNCKLTLTEFRKTGLFGCAVCYETFSDEIRKMVFKIHGSNHHTGSIPGVKMKPNLTRLHKDLEAAIQNEEYEQAAHLRDLIRGIENEN